MPEQRVAMLPLSRFVTFKAAYVIRGIDGRLSRTARNRDDHGRLFVLKNTLVLVGNAGKASSSFENTSDPKIG